MVCANQSRMSVGEAGNAISLLCAGQATKNVLVDGSAEACCQMGAHETWKETKLVQTYPNWKCISIWNKWTGWKAIVCSNWNKSKMASGEACNAIGKLCAGRTTKIVWVDCAAESLVAHWDGEMPNKETQKRGMFGYIQTQKDKNELVKMSFCSNRDKNCWSQSR